MTKAEKTREYIIEKAAPIFNMKGYSGTSLHDLIEATGLTKGAIYGNFENKDEVAVAVYEYNVASFGKGLQEAVNAQNAAADKIIAFVQFYRASWKIMFEKGGCPLLNASVEADDNLPFLKKNVQNTVKNLAQIICDIIETGKQAGEFKKDIVSLDYAYTLLALIEGGIMLSKISGNQNLLFTALDRGVKIINEEIKE